MATERDDEREVARSFERVFSFTPSTFIKREIPLQKRHISCLTGKPMEKPWLAERTQNEALALALIHSQTSIPVPYLESWGRDSRGLCYLETQRVPGIRGDMAGNSCRMSTELEAQGIDCPRILFDSW